MEVQERLEVSARYRISAVASGLLSASLWSSLVLGWAFLLPVQFAFGRLGRRGGLMATAIALSGAALFGLVELGLNGGMGVRGILASILVPGLPFALLCLVNAKALATMRAIYRLMLASLVVAAAASPFVITALADEGLRKGLVDSVGSMLGKFLAATGQSVAAGQSALPDDYDRAAVMSALDPSVLVDFSLKLFTSGFAAMAFLAFGGSWWLGNRLAGPGSPGQQEAPALKDFRLPAGFVWPFLGLAAFLLGILALRAPEWLQAVGWNLALIPALAYAAQGAGIVSHLLARLGLPRILKILIIAIIAASALGSTAGLGIAAILPLLGLTELWIPYRSAKGVDA